jgi:SAM-dependent methyltransferase
MPQRFGADRDAVSSVAMAGATNYFRWQLEAMSSHISSRVLEIGCGVGEFTRVLLGRECVVSVDIDSEMIESLRRSLVGHPEWHGLVADVTQDAFPEQVAAYRCTSVTALNVVEHIDDDLRALRAIHKILPRSGKAAVLVPAHSWLYGPMDEAAGHYRRYTKEEITYKMAEAGFEIDRALYFNMIGAVGWYVNYRLLRITKAKRGTTAQIRLFDKYVVPIARNLERIGPPPFGMSVICLATVP